MEEVTFRDAMSFRHLRIAAKDCTKGVTWKPSVQNFEVNALQWTATLHGQLLDHTYKSMGFYKFWLTERGKRRFIQSVHISERAVQKCANNYGMKPLVEPRLIYDNGASRKGKGTEFAIRRLRQHLATHYRKYGRSGGILTMDFHDYFNSIPHKRLYEIIRRIVPDEELYCLVRYFIACFGKRGLGLGSELSQISAILYPDILDHYIKERLYISGYARYMDDSYIIHQDTEYLQKCLAQVQAILEEIGLELNPKTKITLFDGGSFVFLKRRFSIGESGKIITRLERTNITKRRRIMRRQKKKLDAGEADMASIRQSYQSWRGYAAKWDSRRTVYTMDQLYKELFGEEGNPNVKRRKCRNNGNTGNSGGDKQRQRKCSGSGCGKGTGKRPGKDRGSQKVNQ